MSRLVVSPKAAADAESIGDYVAQHDPRAAERLIARLFRLSELLLATPQMGPARPDIADGLRYFPLGNYLMFYRVLGDGIEIVRILDGRRDLTKVRL